MLQLYEKKFNSRLLLGTSKYPSISILEKSIHSSGTEIVTVSLRRQSPENNGGSVFWNAIQNLNVTILPNTAGCFSVKEAVTTAKMARLFFKTNWIKLEVIGDEFTLQPNPFLLLEATKQLIADGFEVFPYMTDDLILAKELVYLGCKVLMPWAAPIGSGQGFKNLDQIKLIRKNFPTTTIIIDAGIGAPSHAAKALEIGCDGVLLNSAVAHSPQPDKMAKAFSLAIEGGRMAYNAGLMPKSQFAIASSPTIGVPFL